MKKEIEFLQGAFESYKSSLHQDMAAKWNKREEDLKMQLQEEKQAAIHEMSKARLSQRCPKYPASGSRNIYKVQYRVPGQS